MRSTILPSPLHLGPSFMGFGALTWRQKLQIGRGMAGMFLAGSRKRDEVEAISFAQYLLSHGQSAETIRAYWDVICVSSLNEPAETVSAKYAMQVFQEGFMQDRQGYRLGYARVPLASLYHNLAGVVVRGSASVASLNVQAGAVNGVTLVGGEILPADWVVLATNPSNAIPLLRPVVGSDEQFARIAQLQFRPILGANLLYDRAINLRHPIAMMGTRLQWVFPNEKRPELIHGVVSAADTLPAGADLPKLFDEELKSALPAFGSATLVDSVMVREARATFRPLPGCDALRPTQSTAVPGLTLAGDYTKTDWPATMEGAARSGRRAADVLASAMSLDA